MAKLENYSKYEFNEDGTVLALNWKGSKIKKLMTPALSGGYLKTVFVNDDGKNVSITVHRMIAKAFIPNPHNKSEVNHINGIKTDNRVENLEWVTHQENIIHAFKNNLENNIGENNPFSKMTPEKIREIRAKFKPRKYTREMLAKEYGLKASTIKDIVLRKSWSHVD